MLHINKYFRVKPKPKRAWTTIYVFFVSGANLFNSRGTFVIGNDTIYCTGKIRKFINKMSK